MPHKKIKIISFIYIIFSRNFLCSSSRYFLRVHTNTQEKFQFFFSHEYSVHRYIYNVIYMDQAQNRICVLTVIYIYTSRRILMRSGNDLFSPPSCLFLCCSFYYATAVIMLPVLQQGPTHPP
jgi:hypothetical protein